MTAGTITGRSALTERRRAVPWKLLETDGLVVTAVAVWVLLLALWLPALVVPDTWLALVDGRLIASRGVPHTDPFGAWTLGRVWTDQQWGAHLALYELARHLGVWAVVCFGAAAVAAALSVAAVAARKLGSTARSAAVVLLLPVLAAPWMTQARTQSFAVLLFPVVYGLLTLDSRSPSRRVLWVIPILIVWANLHGSVVLAAALAAAHGIVMAARARSLRTRGVLLTVGSVAAVFASPYALALPAYYQTMIIHPSFAGAVTEWGPASFSKLSAVFFFTAFVSVSLAVTHRAALTWFERCALPVLLVASLSAMRNAIWFEIALAVSLPRLLDRAWPSTAKLTPAVRRINVRVAVVAIAVAAVISVIQVTTLTTRVAQAFPASAAASVAHAAGQNGIVFADDLHSDWLAWEQPTLVGRIAFDVRFELFDAAEMAQILRLRDNAHSVWVRCGQSATVVTFASTASAQRARSEGVFNHGVLLASTAGFAAVRQRPTATSCALAG